MNNNTTVAGLNLLAPAFQDVGFASIKLNGLKVANSEGGEVTSNSCGIDVIDADGNTVTHYSWASSGRGAAKTWGWQEGGSAVGDTVVFGRGVGVLFTAENAADTLSSSGEVNLDALTISETVAGLNVVANPYPTTVKLNTVAVSNSEGGEVTSNSCGIDLIDADGNTLAHYSWASSGRGATKTWGWQEGGSSIDDAVVLAPGQAVLFTAENSGDKVIFAAQK